MKMKYRILLFSFIGLLTIYGILRVTGGIQFYSPMTTSTPEIIKGKTLVFTNLLTPKRYDLVSFTTPEVTPYGDFFLQRLVGLPGDTIHIKEGTLFVNCRSRDDSLNLRKRYYAPDYSREVAFKLGIEHIHILQLGDSLLLELTSEELKSFNNLTPYIECSKSRIQLHPDFDSSWTSDCFGPVVIPEKHFFILNDTRSHAFDSRVFGFLPEENILGVKLF